MDNRLLFDTQFLVFGKLGQFIVLAENYTRAIQKVISETDTTATNWNCHIFKSYPQKLQTKILNDFRTIIL
jgi:hypothetical protein